MDPSLKQWDKIIIGIDPGTNVMGYGLLGISAKHSVFFHRLALDGAVGVYLYRHMGANAEIIEKPYYERIGLSYSFPILGGLTLGASVKAHLTKADFTELTLSLPIRIK